MTIPEGLTFAQIVDMLAAMTPADRNAFMPPVAAAELVTTYPELAEVASDDVTIDGPEAKVHCRRYRSTTTPTRGGLVWVHGGAFIGGDLDFPEAHWVALTISQRGFAVLSVDYRLCLGGVCFPAPSDDVLAAWRWAVDRASELGTTTDRLHLGGGSAGANLVAGVTKRLRDSGETMPATLLLVYGLMHPSLPEPSDELRAAIAGDQTVIPPDICAQICLNYAGSERALGDPYAFAANGDVANQPPVYVLNSEIDTLRSSGEVYAQQLAAAGVDVTLDMEPGSRHGHLNEPFGGLGSQSLDRITRWLEARTPAVSVATEKT